jgi:FkbM family methyltransferase
VVGFEPHPECAAACRKSIELNSFKNVTFTQKVLSDSRKYVSFEFDSLSPNASKITEKKDSLIEASTLDAELVTFYGNSIILMDVEGAELKVTKGGRSFIQRWRPLIIFEFNQVTKHYFSIDEMRDELGKEYCIYRLRSDDGKLDDQINEAWNCVAVHMSSPFYEACAELMHG